MDLVTDRLDDALEILDGSAPEYGGGLSNHGPMAAEALSTLEQTAAIVPWTERYRRKLGDEPAPGKPVRRDEIREALGQVRRYPDWLALFLDEFREGPWEPAIDRWVPELARGFAGAATHGVIRAGHAARSLARHDTPGRRRELARGFAYWAATYQALPWEETSPAHLMPEQALTHVPRLPDDVPRRGSIAQGLKLATTLPDFPGVISLVDAGAPDTFVPALGDAFARVFLAGTTTSKGRTIALIHAVTGPAAAGLLARHVSARTAAHLLTCAWQAGAAIYAVFGKPPQSMFDEPRASREALIAGAVKSGDEHAIKFTEACLRLDAVAPSPAFAAAAARAIELRS